MNLPEKENKIVELKSTNGWVLSKWVPELIKKHFGLNVNWLPKKYRKLVTVVGLIILCVPGYLYYDDLFSLLGTNRQPASALNSTEVKGNSNNVTVVQGNNNTFNNIPPKDNKNDFIFDLEKWTDGFGSLWILNKDCNQITLPPGEKNGTKKYSDPIGNEVSFSVEFQPKRVAQKPALNFLLSMHGIYYIVVGDSDDKTVVLRATKGSDPLDANDVPELTSGSKRTSLEMEPDLSQLIRINFEQVKVGEELLVQFDINYWDMYGGSRTNSFKYLFTPSGLIKNDKYLHIGSVGNDKSKGVSIKMNNPLFCVEEVSQ